MAKKVINRNSELYFGGGTNMSIKSASIVSCHNTLTLVKPEGGVVQLDVRIEADFDTIPENYHEVFMNIMCAKYLQTVSFGDNPFSQCIPQPKKKWYQFWKK